jgi:hypothetical protein
MMDSDTNSWSDAELEAGFDRLIPRGWADQTSCKNGLRPLPAGMAALGVVLTIARRRSKRRRVAW